MAGFILSGMLDITGVAELKVRLGQALDELAPVELDATDLSWIDASALQLLVAFLQEATQRGIAVSWLAVSDELMAAAQLMGLDKSLQLPSVGPSGE